MVFTKRVPDSWQELQVLTAKYLNEAGYKAHSPHTISTARGDVEVDVFIEAPSELVKFIICECKYWNTPVTKEKIHAFRMVVHDSGAELGIFISKSGYQSGAKKASKYSNVRLETWDSFLDLIFDKWITRRLYVIRTMAAKIGMYTDRYSYLYENLQDSEREAYYSTCRSVFGYEYCVFTTKTDLIYDKIQDGLFYSPCQFGDIECYFDFLYYKFEHALSVFSSLSVQPSNPEKYIHSLNSFLEEQFL